MSNNFNAINSQMITTYLGITTRKNYGNVDLICPACQRKKFSMNLDKMTGQCLRASCVYNGNGNGLTYLEYAKAYKERIDGESYEIPALAEKILEKNGIFGAVGGNLKEEKPSKPVQSPLAPIKEVDKTYRTLLSLLRLHPEDRANLLSRGFTDEQIKALNYKSYPDNKSWDFRDICRKLRNQGCKLEGVPGFFINDSGEWTMKYITPGIMVPHKTVNNMIYGFQIRKRDSLRKTFENGEKEPKCVWLSSGDFNHGTGAKTSINFSTNFFMDSKTNKQWLKVPNGKLVLTEGAMKADLCRCLMPEMNLISVAGVQATTYLEQTLGYLKKLGISTIVLAYDMDYKTNESVFASVEKTKKIIKEAGMELAVLEWDSDLDGKECCLKGLDDYLAYKVKGIIPA